MQLGGRSLVRRFFSFHQSQRFVRYTTTPLALSIATSFTLTSIPHQTTFNNALSIPQNPIANVPTICSVIESQRKNSSETNTTAQQNHNYLSNWLEKSKQFIHNRTETEGAKVVSFITLANVGVYILWQVVPSKFMLRHFVNSLQAIKKRRVWTNVTSNFSHMGLFHLSANMYLLNKFGEEVADILGQGRFFMFYVTSGVASSLVSLTYRRMTKSPIQSLGASGAVVATLWLNACFFPDRRMAFPFTENGVTMQELVLIYSIFDAGGLLGSFGLIDFAAHLGGAIFGNIWFHMMRDQLVREQNTKRINKNDHNPYN